MTYSQSLSNAQLAEARARILAKLETDEIVGKADKLSYQEKSKKVNEIIKDLSQEDTKAFIKNSTQKQKADAVQNIIDQLRDEEDDKQRHKDKLKVDREAEKVRNAPAVIRPDSSYVQKSAEVSNIQKFYAREVKKERAEQDRIERESAKVNRLDKDVFKFIERVKPANDIYSYRKILNRYSGLATTRSYVENPQRVLYSQIVVGSYFSFRYWAKGYQDLPKFDRSPLIYVLSNNGDSFTGINFHWANSNSESFSYVEEIEKQNNNIPFRDECYHTYLTAPQHLLSPLYHISPDEIRTAILLPLVSWYIR